MQTVHSTKCTVGRRNSYIRWAQTDLVKTIQGSLNGNLCSCTVWNGNHGLGEAQGIGHSQCNRMFAHNIALVQHLCSNLSGYSVGGEYSVLDGTHASFLDCPFHIIGNIHLGTNRIGSERIKCNGSAGSIVIVFGTQRCALKFTGYRSGGDNQESVGGRTLTSVRQRAVDLQILTRTLRHEGGGAAAVTVSSVDTTQLDHILAHFIHVETGRIRSLTSVGNGENDLTLSSNSHEGAGLSTTCVIFCICRLRDSVRIGLDQPLPNGDSILLPTSQRIGLGTHHHLGHIGWTRLASQGMVVVVDNNDGIIAREGCSTLAVLIVVTIQNVVVQGLTDQVRICLVVVAVIPAQHSVGSGNDVTVAKSLSILSLSRGRLGAIVASRRNHALVTRDHLGVGIVHIDLYAMNNLSVRTVCIIQNRLGFFDARRKSPVFFGNELVIVIIFHTIRIILNRCSKSVQLNNANEGHYHKQHRQNFTCSFLHNKPP